MDEGLWVGDQVRIIDPTHPHHGVIATFTAFTDWPPDRDTLYCLELPDGTPIQVVRDAIEFVPPWRERLEAARANPPPPGEMRLIYLGRRG